MFERVALMASRCGDAYAISMAVEGSARTAVVPELGIFSTWTEAERIARSLNTELGLSSSDSRQIVADVLLGAVSATCLK